MVGLKIDARRETSLMTGNFARSSITYDENAMREYLLRLDVPCYVVHSTAGIGIVSQEKNSGSMGEDMSIAAVSPPVLPE